MGHHFDRMYRRGVIAEEVVEDDWAVAGSGAHMGLEEKSGCSNEILLNLLESKWEMR